MKEILLFDDKTAGWFLAALIIFTFLTWCLRNQNLYFILLMGIAVGCVAGYDAHTMAEPVLSRVVCWFPFYYLGSFTKTETITNFVRQNRKKCFAFGVFVIFIWGVACVVFRSTIYSDLIGIAIPVIKYSDMPYPYNGGWKLLSYVFVALLIAAFMFIIPTHRIPILSNMCRNT